jgi:hypothetical protein
MKYLSAIVLLGAGALPSAWAVEPKFQAQEIDAKVVIGYGLAIGDVDGDKKPDILLADKKQIKWYQNPGKAGAPWPMHVMAENLTSRDNVCIAARDIDGDGKVEVAVGAMWNPGDTNSPEKSGAVFYLKRPEDPTKKWTAIQIKPHDPTTHRMRWIRVGKDAYRLIVLPLHGIGNKGGKGAPVRVMAYTMPKDPTGEWKQTVVDASMHMTHNMDVLGSRSRSEMLLVGGKEGFVGIRAADASGSKWTANVMSFSGLSKGAGEVRGTSGEISFAASIEPLHGNAVVAYVLVAKSGKFERRVLDESLRAGHALAVTDLLGTGWAQVVAGWRSPDANKKVGIRLYAPTDASRTKWKTYLIDDNGMACEDLKVADLDGDGKPEIIACGRSSKNLKIYWNQTPKP